MNPDIKFDLVAQKKKYLKETKTSQDDFDLELFLL